MSDKPSISNLFPLIDDGIPRGRFAPSPTGRMHLGNVYAALISWLSIKLKGGRWVLRIEDLDHGRSRSEYAMLLQDDLRWLGLHWDEGGTDNIGPAGPYLQSLRSDIYAAVADRLKGEGRTYFCTCRRADILASQAPHQSDGRVIYSGKCRSAGNLSGAARLIVPDAEIDFNDEILGPQKVNLSTECGDFIICRADGQFAYQLAVVVDDALMGITEVVRGNDLLLSAAQQSFLYDILNWRRPAYAHFPLLCNRSEQRLSKRDQSLSLHQLRLQSTPDEIIGRLAYASRLIPQLDSISPTQLLQHLQSQSPHNPQSSCDSQSNLYYKLSRLPRNLIIPQ